MLHRWLSQTYFVTCLKLCFSVCLRFAKSSEDGQRALKPLAGGFAATVWALVGDLEYLNAVLKLPHYASKSNPCALCQRTGGTASTSWKNCKPSAEWLKLQWSPDELLVYQDLTSTFVCDAFMWMICGLIFSFSE